MTKTPFTEKSKISNELLGVKYTCINRLMTICAIG